MVGLREKAGRGIRRHNNNKKGGSRYRKNTDNEKNERGVGKMAKKTGTREPKHVKS